MIEYQPTQEDIDQFTLIATHIITAINEITNNTKVNNLAYYFLGLGYFFEGQTNYHEAKKWLRKGLIICKSNSQQNNQTLFYIHNNIATIDYLQAKYVKATRRYRFALERLLKVLGEQELKKSELAALLMSNIGECYIRLKKYEKAEEILQRSLEIRQEIKRDSLVAHSLNNLGILYRAMANYEKAENFLRKGLEIRQNSLDFNDPQIANSYKNLGKNFQLQGKYNEAQNCYQDALDICNKSLANIHPLIAIIIYNQAELHHLQTDYRQAETLYLQALDMRKELLGNNHLITKNTKQQFIKFLQEVIKAGRVEELSDNAITQDYLKSLE